MKSRIRQRVKALGESRRRDVRSRKRTSRREIALGDGHGVELGKRQDRIHLKKALGERS